MKEEEPPPGGDEPERRYVPPRSRAARRRARAQVRRRRTAAAGVLAAVVALVVLVVWVLPSAGPAGTGAAAPGGPSATWAEPVGAPPDYVFPFAPARYDDPANVEDLQYLLYRPLYSFRPGDPTELDPARSLADPPTYSAGDTTVTVTLRADRWSDGEAVTAEDVMLWMNLLHAEKANWGGYVAGGAGIPDDVASVTADSSSRLTFQLTGPVDPRWFTDDELSQVTPLPLAWDRTAPGGAAGSGGCAAGLYGTVDSQCASVFTFLSRQAGYDPADPTGPNTELATYGRNPLWQVVDGPWTLRRLTAGGEATFVPNPRYSGPDRPSLRQFVELPFGSESAEAAALRAGQVDVGYLPLDQAAGRTADPGRAGPQAGGLGNFTLSPTYPWGIGYAAYNFDSTGDGGQAGPIFRQLYVRQAFQDLVDQPGQIAAAYHGYGLPTEGPVPASPGSAGVTGGRGAAVGGAGRSPYPYDPGRATTLLAAHGWHVDPGGTSTCRRPGSGHGECGAGIARGARLSFTLAYAAGDPTLQQVLSAERASWARAGIAVALRAEPAGTVEAGATACPTGCRWELADWGTGWLYSPAAYPTGEAVFRTGAPYDAGSYSNATADADIAATISGGGGGDASLAAYQRELARQLPVLYQPVPATLTEIRDGLAGAAPEGPGTPLTPEQWHWSR